VSADRTSAVLLRLYPPRWRERYGDELAGLIVETSGGRVPWRVRRDVAGAALRERGRSLLGRSDRSPRQTISSALPSVLWAWLLVVVGGCAVAKTAEHWQAATPPGSRSLPAHAFDVLIGAAAAGALIVVAGAALAVPAAVRGLRSGRGGSVRRGVAVALASTAALVPATAGLAAWAHGLTAAQRNGHDAAYGGAFAAWVVLFLVCLAAWTRLGSRLARQADLRSFVLRVEAWLAGAAATAMALITTAAAVWWAAVADAAPWFFGGGPQGSAGTAVTWPLVAAGLLMAAGTLLAATAAARCLRALPALAGRG
jgi:hypothetical protein